MPAILDGRRAEEGSLPTFAKHPRNLFTLLGDSYRLNVSEEATYLCPPRLCPDAAQPSLGERMRSLSEDFGVVYAHMVLPSALEDELPSVSEGWGDFNGGDSGRGGARDARRQRAAGALRGLAARRSGRPRSRR